MTKTESSEIPPHLPMPEEIEAIGFYEALLEEGWEPVTGNQWVNEPGKMGYYLIRMERDSETLIFQSPVALPIVSLPES